MAGKVRIGIVGAGGIARSHAKAIADTPGAKLTAISDVSPKAAKAASEEFGVPGFINHKEMYKSGLVDAVTICTPHWFHPQLSVDASRAGLHVLTEKPMAVTAEGCDRMIAAARKARKILQVVYQRRYMPVVRKFHEMVAGGALGKVYRVMMKSPWFRSNGYYASAGWRGTWKGEGGGVLMNQGPHPIDEMLYVAGIDPVRIMAVTETTPLHPKIEVEDRASALLWFKGGAIGYMYVSTTDGTGGEFLEVAGDKGTLLLQGNKLLFSKLDVPISKFVQKKEMWCSPTYKVKDITPKPGKSSPSSHTPLMRDFVKCILKGGKPVVTGEEGLRSVEVINGALLSGHTGKPVDIPTSRPAMKKLMNSLIAQSKAGKNKKNRRKK
ncbi:MAG: Gfo/Idh/MocA family oxidoreductase [Planctomycetes bacterium]|nr:Gfo/Idh/MocA family oxidoreductase [Planctomycetota bacterium]